MKMLFSLVVIALVKLSHGEESYLPPTIPLVELPPEVAELYGKDTEPVDTSEDDRFLNNFFNFGGNSDCGNSTYFLQTPSASSDDERIVGGAIISERIQPWTAEVYMLVNSTISGLCTGSLIYKQWVLTAAHCVKGYTAPNVLVVMGNFTKFAGETFKVIDVIVHEDYAGASNGFKGDIALLKLEKEVTYTERIRSICLPKKPASKYDYRMGTVAGFGRISALISSSYLKQGILLVAGQELCSVNEGYSIDIIPGQMCGYTAFAKDSICNGDSGGPFSIVEDKITYQIGVSSLVRTGCIIDSLYNPNIFADVYYYKSWINRKTGNCFLGIFC